MCSEFVPREASVSDLCEFLLVDKQESLDTWIYRIQELRKVDAIGREMMADNHMESGYDVHQKARWPYDFYADHWSK